MFPNSVFEICSKISALLWPPLLPRQPGHEEALGARLVENAQPSGDPSPASHNPWGCCESWYPACGSCRCSGSKGSWCLGSVSQVRWTIQLSAADWKEPPLQSWQYSAKRWVRKPDNLLKSTLHYQESTRELETRLCGDWRQCYLNLLGDKSKQKNVYFP